MIAEVIEANSIGQMKPNRDVWQYHFWQGRPGLWRSMIPKAESRVARLEMRRECLRDPGLSGRSGPELEPLQADLNWLQLQLHSTREHLGLERTKHRKAIAEAMDLRERLLSVEKELANLKVAFQASHTELMRYRYVYLDPQLSFSAKGANSAATNQRLETTYEQLEATYQELDKHVFRAWNFLARTGENTTGTRCQRPTARRDPPTLDRLSGTSRFLGRARSPDPEMGLRAMRLYRK